MSTCMTHTLTSFLVLLMVAAGPTTEPTTAPTTVEMDVKRFSGIDIPYPKGWSARELSQLDGLLIICPTTDADWQANVFVELRPVAHKRSLSDSLDSLAKELKERKHGFVQLDKRIATHPRGFEYGVIDYTCKDVTGLALLEHEVILPLSGDRRLYLLFSTAEAVKEKYEPIFEQMLEALRVQ
jgi:hypothetical protein